MNRYERDFRRPQSSGRGYDQDMRGSSGERFGGSGRGGEFRGGRSGGGSGYDRGFRGAAQAGGRDFRDRERGAAPWYPNPGRGMAEGFGDFSGRGRYGGYWGAADLRPMMANPDAEMRRNSERGRGRRER
jgi:hypothetical protein